MSAAEIYKRLSPDEETSPCSLKGCMNLYVRDQDKSHATFMEALGLGAVQPACFSHVSTRTKFYTELKRGLRDLAWGPPGLGILDHLEPFFLAHGVRRGIETIIHGEDRSTARAIHILLKENRSRESWLISWCLTQEPQPETPSGFFTKELLPDANQLMLLIARAIFRGYTVPFASQDSHKPIFARTCTLMGETQRLAIAYLPGHAILVRSFEADAIQEDLVNPGAVPIILVR